MLYITKPFQIAEMLARINTHLELRALQHRLRQEIQKRTQAEAELRLRNQQLQEANQQLQAANASKDKFFTIIAHDLRSPFTALLGFLEISVEQFNSLSPDHLKKILARLWTSSKHLYALLENLLLWSRLQQEALTRKPETFLLSPVIMRNLHLLALQAEQKQIQMHPRVPAHLTVSADLNMVNTVIRNLLSNALKFTPAGGAIAISAQPQADHMVAIVVSDSGLGMSQDVLDRLFRIDVKQSRKGTNGEEGTGLGLILCKDLVERNGGTLRVESQVDQGSRFIVCLPYAEMPSLPGPLAGVMTNGMEVPAYSKIAPFPSAEYQSEDDAGGGI